MIHVEQAEPRREYCPPVGVRWHEYAEIFPWIEGEAFRALVEDIRQNGVLEPIVMLDGAILDGRNRYMAARELGIEYPVIEYEGIDPLGFVISHNLTRRHLTESQRGMVHARLAKLPKGRPEGNTAIAAITQEQASAILNVSADTGQRAKKVIEHGEPELVAAVDAGTDVADKMDEQVADWQRGFDQLLMLQGIEAKTLGITLPSPEHFFAIALQSFAASIPIPMKILVGSQTGERASTEDAQEWAQTNMSRRNNVVIPNILKLVNRLEQIGILPEKDWHLDWTDLTESSMAEKIDRAVKMADTNQKMKDSGEIVFTHEEIRAAVDMEPLSPT
jgi:hypothetical protein